jgi:hypothetical protein
VKPQLSNSAIASFYLWAENKLLKDGEAFHNYSSRLYYMPDERLPGYVTYSSPFKQWVYDQGILGAQVCSGISGSISLSNYESGLQIDYVNGRVILPSSFGTGLTLSGSFSFKEINFYLPNETEEDVLTNSKFYLNSRFQQFPDSGIAPYTYLNPATYVNLLNNYNEPFALGGTQEANFNLSLVTNTETMYQLDGANFVFSSMQDKSFPLLTIYEWPLNEFGNVKSGIYSSGYNYEVVKAEKCLPGNLFYVEKVRCSKLSDKIKLNDKLFVGIADIDICRVF